mmetsp:Transcript_67178/g.149891  ORF Transcript_67178/g.149891 Transcript_67178/m.149891 type:complete len:84 (+) Transcript_67178:56-307(+)
MGGGHPSSIPSAQMFLVEPAAQLASTTVVVPQYRNMRLPADAKASPTRLAPPPISSSSPATIQDKNADWRPARSSGPVSGFFS